MVNPSQPLRPTKQNPCCSYTDRGVTLYTQNTIYIAAGGGRKENEILGTLAHELTHLAMYLVFNNDCKPYKINSDEQIEFQILLKEIQEKIKYLKGDPKKTLTEAFGYSEWEQAKELIVRVPHILMQYHDGRTWLSDNSKKLIAFYKEKVIPECEKYIEEISFLKPRNFIKSFNEEKGEMNNIKSKSLFFKNVGLTKVKNFFDNTTKGNIFAFASDNTWIGLLKVLQALFGIEYSKTYDRFLVFKFENFVNSIEHVRLMFCSQATDTLIIECSNNSRNQISYEKFKDIMLKLKK